MSENLKELLTMLLALALIFWGLVFIAYGQIILPVEPVDRLGSLQMLQVERSWFPDTPDKVNLLADAIFWAEGGYNTNYPYGIQSIRCEGYDECRRICKNTIKNNIKRWRSHSRQRIYMEKRYSVSYLTYLWGRYCPTTGNLTRSEKELNGFWLKNVKWFLDNPKELPSQN